ncbi:uncharacterized protein LOC125470952 [Pyrus x bretschneideri]|uniref:uncharacterized protein LOC125470952 n=1 Tax=Pyrus x bretschneideri TaxID=225117 RepID=UPI00202F8A2A|nr:uncharacterized protein LOC125470952 [Pyrus x bretschneideri]
MSNLNKLDFSTLEVSGRNDLKWVQDVKLHLTAKGIRATIETPIADKPIDKAQKATAMIFIRRHIHDALHTEYLAEEDPRTLWLALANLFDHQKDIYLPEDHWSRLCQASPEAIATYHSRHESNFTHVDHLEDATTSIEILDFQEASAPMDE